MTITSLDLLVAGFVPGIQPVVKVSGSNLAAGTYHSTWYLGSMPAAGAAPAASLNGANYVAPVNGGIAVPAAVSGAQSYLSRIEFVPGATSNVAMVSIIDRLWANGGIGITTTGAQAITQPTLPARDATGSTSGVGVLVAIEVSALCGNGAVANTTMSYTNSSGTAGRTATITSFPAAATVDTWVVFNLAAGDVGVQSIQSLTLGTSYVSGTINLVAFRELVRIPLAGSLTAVDRSAYQLDLPRVYNSSVVSLVYLPSSTTFGTLVGSLAYAQG